MTIELNFGIITRRDGTDVDGTIEYLNNIGVEVVDVLDNTIEETATGRTVDYIKIFKCKSNMYGWTRAILDMKLERISDEELLYVTT